MGTEATALRTHYTLAYVPLHLVVFVSFIVNSNNKYSIFLSSVSNSSKLLRHGGVVVGLWEALTLKPSWTEVRLTQGSDILQVVSEVR